MCVDFGNQLVDLAKYRLVALHTPLMSRREDVLVVVFELLPTDSADHMVRAGLGLLKTHRIFLMGLQLFLLFLKIFDVLLI